jgi:hypothetical protein
VIGIAAIYGGGAANGIRGNNDTKSAFADYRLQCGRCIGARDGGLLAPREVELVEVLG